jgi:hypothetical protein
MIVSEALNEVTCLQKKSCTASGDPPALRRELWQEHAEVAYHAQLDGRSIAA